MPASEVASVPHSSPLLSARSVTALATSLGVSFLLAYVVFHGLHALHHDPEFVTRLAKIPLFATCEAAALFGVTGGVLLAPVVAQNEPIYRQMAKALLISVALFTLEILILP